MVIKKLVSWNLREQLSNSASSLNVNAELIGESAVGKSTLFLAISKYIADEPLPSGLYFSSDDSDPQKNVQRITNSNRLEKILVTSGMNTTLDDPKVDYVLYDGDDERVHFSAHEVIGQYLTNPNASPEAMEFYKRYIKRLPKSDVLWVMVPSLPANPTQADYKQFETHCKIANSYLRSSISMRKKSGNHRQCSAALVISKVDQYGEDVESARATLTNDLFKNSLRPLINTLRRSSMVQEAIVAPVSAFGFGNSKTRASSTNRKDDAYAANFLLDGMMSPYNVDSLLLWTLLTGILQQDVSHADRQDKVMSKVARELMNDLTDSEPWFMPIKGRIFC